MKDKYQGKYNPDGHDGILFQFSDQGRGIDKKDLPRIFTRFFRSEDVNSIPGTGLGLAIANDFAHLHQGKIYAESTYGEGTIISVFLPYLEKPPNL